MIDTLAYLLPALGCAAMMGVMMWMMRRDQSTVDAPPEPTREEQIEALRAEVAALRQGAQAPSGSGVDGLPEPTTTPEAAPSDG